MLQQRIHPAASRVNLLAARDPGELRRVRPAGARRRGPDRAPVRASAGPGWSRRWRRRKPPVHLTPITDDHELAPTWFEQFEGAGLDGLIAKKPDQTYQPDKRVMTKIKHERTCRLRGRRLPGAQVRPGRHRLAAARAVRRARRAGLGRGDRRVPDGPAQGAVHRAAAAGHRRSTGTRGTGRRTSRASARRARTRPAAGTPARTCRSSRCARSGWSRCATTTWRACGSGTPRSSCAGARTASRSRAPTSSWSSR